MEKAFIRFRQSLAATLFVLWAACAFWSNKTHYYDAQAIQQEIAALYPNGPAPELEPSRGGFPVFHMRYEFSPSGQLIIHEYSTDKLGLNILLCSLATIAVSVLVLRTTTISRNTWIVAVGWVLPVCVVYALLRLHPLLVVYVYFYPLFVLTGSFLGRMFRHDDARHQGTVQNRSVAVLDN